MSQATAAANSTRSLTSWSASACGRRAGGRARIKPAAEITTPVKKQNIAGYDPHDLHARMEITANINPSTKVQTGVRVEVKVRGFTKERVRFACSTYCVSCAVFLFAI